MSAAFDVSRVVATACAADPSLTPALAEQLATEAWAEISAGAADAPEVSRRLLAAHEHVSPSETNAVATAAIGFCESAGLLP